MLNISKCDCHWIYILNNLIAQRYIHTQTQKLIHTRPYSFMSQDLVVKPKVNNQFSEAVLTADRHYCLQ